MLADEPLRLHVRGARIVAAHAVEHLQEIVAAVLRAENPLQRMAVRAIEQVALQLVRTGALASISALVNCSNSTGAGLSLRSAVAVLPAASSTVPAPSSA